jgi:hypothetical protein
VAGGFRWLIDTNHDGIIDPDEGDHATIQPNGFQINGLPVAGDFDGNEFNGDEIGLFDGTRWYFDTNKNWIIDGGDLVLSTSLRGSPIVGDFNGDEILDLATWKTDQFFFNFGSQPGGGGTQPSWSGTIDAVINWGLPGTAEKPVALDLDMDGITDIGLVVPGRTGTLPLEANNWYFLISNAFDEEYRGGNQVNALNHPFSPAPLGHDLHAVFGDGFALPVVGNFDPPVARPSMPTAVALDSFLGTLPLGTHTIDGEQWYSFTPLRSGTLNVDARSTSGYASVSTSLYDADYRMLGSSGGSASSIAQSSLHNSVSAGETYLLRLRGTNATADIQLVNDVPEADACDTSRDGRVSPLDALQVINELLASGSSQPTPLVATNAKMYLDTTLDGRISPVDALRVINYLISHTSPPTASPLTSTSSGGGSATSMSAAMVTPFAAAATPVESNAISFGLSVAGLATTSPTIAPAPSAADLVFASLAEPPAGAPAADIPREAAVAVLDEPPGGDEADELDTDLDLSWLD